MGSFTRSKDNSGVLGQMQCPQIQVSRKLELRIESRTSCSLFLQTPGLQVTKAEENPKVPNCDSMRQGVEGGRKVGGIIA